jgi:ligand-binding sensor domain-containing protein/signal transduction histidine kinase
MGLNTISKFVFKSSFFFAKLAFCVHTIHAQQLPFHAVTLEDGLSQSHINCILQDCKGFLWFGTNGGLNRYDGIDFSIYNHYAADSNSIRNNQVHCLYEDNKKRLWIGTQDGISVFDQVLQRIHNILPGMDDWVQNRVNAIIQDQSGTMWIGTETDGLYRYLEDSARLEKFNPLDLNPSVSISAMSITPDSTLWIAAPGSGLYMHHLPSGAMAHFSKGDSGLNTDAILSLYSDKEGVLWIGSEQGLFKVNYADHQRKRYSFSAVRGQLGTLKASFPVISIYQGMSGLLWLGTENKGLYSYNKYSFQYQQFSYDASAQKGLLSNMVTSVFDDRSGILWIGTNAGINKVDRQNERFFLLRKEPGNENSLSNNNVQCIHKEPSGVLWIGTFDGGLNHYDPIKKQFTTWLTDDVIEGGDSRREMQKLLRQKNQRRKYLPDNRNQYLSSNRVLSLLRDYQQGRLFIGTSGGGLNVLDIRSQSIKVYRTYSDHEDSISSNTIRDMAKDKPGNIWLATDKGINMWNGKAFSTTIHGNDLSSIDARTILIDKKQRLWVGTSGAGLRCIDLNTGESNIFRQRKNDQSSLSSDIVFCLFNDNKDRLWVGTASGLNMLQDSVFIRYDSHDGLPSSFIYSIEEDKDGNLWLSTSNGLSKFNPQTLECKNYDRKDGLQGHEFNHGASWNAGSAGMYFGGINGLNHFKPWQVSDNNYIPEIVLTDFKIFNQTVPVAVPGSVLQRHISETEQIVLSHKDVSFSFEFAALSYTDAEKNQYAYLMENFDDGWNYIGNRRYVNYTNLPPGDYIFKVKGSNNDGIWNEEGVSVKIKILPPFWRTWWFYSLLGVGMMSLGYLFMNMRVKNLQQAKKQLYDEVAARTRQLLEEKNRVEKANAEVHIQKMELENQRNLVVQKNKEVVEARDKIKQALTELRLVNNKLEQLVDERTLSLRLSNEALTKANEELDTFIYRASHDLKGPIARLEGLALIGKMEPDREKYPLYLNMVSESARRMNKTLTRLMQIHQINNCRLFPEIIELDTLMQSIQNVLPEARDVVIRCTLHTRKTLIADVGLMSMVFENLLENSVFYKGNKRLQIDVDLSLKGSFYSIGFSDNGTGIAREHRDKIFNMFYKGTELSHGNGLGLYLVKKAIEKLEGSISLESEEGTYTRFNILLPFRLGNKNTDDRQKPQKYAKT